MSSTAQREAIRRRVQGWRAAELRSLRAQREEPLPSAEASLEAALELCDLAPDYALAEDAVRTREVAAARAAWAKLRARLPCPKNVPER